MADVVTTIVIVAFWPDVIAKVADAIATVCDSSYFWQMLLPRWLMECLPWVLIGRCYGQGGRWNSHWVNVLILILMSCVGTHPICEQMVFAYISIHGWVIDPYE